MQVIIDYEEYKELEFRSCHSNILTLKEMPPPNTTIEELNKYLEKGFKMFFSTGNGEIWTLEDGEYYMVTNLYK